MISCGMVSGSRCRRTKYAMEQIPIPNDVLQWVRDTFRKCNSEVSAKMVRQPNVREESLDLSLIDRLSNVPSPQALRSGWTVSIDTHFLGGGRHWRRWEVADIGLLVMFRQGGRLLRTKVALLQFKRLYPDEQEYDEGSQTDYQIGIAGLFRGSSSLPAVTRPRTFTFKADSKYKALRSDRQVQTIQDYSASYGIPVHYLLYHPWRAPHSVTFPISTVQELVEPVELGCRVLPAAEVHKALVGAECPSLATMTAQKIPEQTPNGPGWALEEFVADWVVKCRAGYIAEKESDPGLARVFNKRTGPIAAGVAITFDAPTHREGTQISKIG